MKYLLTYCDGVTRIKEFASDKDASWYCHMEGDHLIDYEKIEEKKDENVSGLQDGKNC